MGKSFLPDALNQSLLFPLSLRDWLPEGHLARFLVDVVSALDLGARSTVRMRTRTVVVSRPMRRR